MNHRRDDIAGNRGTSTRKPPWPRLFAVLVCSYVHLGSHAAANASAARSPPPRRGVPFLPARNSRRAAEEAYLRHLQDEVTAARRELSVAHTTCGTLRRRWEEQREETLGALAARATAGNEEERRTQEQGGELERMRGQLDAETNKYERQAERLDLLAAELKEMQASKEGQERSHEDQVSQYEHQLRESQQKESDYAGQVELLALKLEAAEFAAKQRRRGDGDVADATWEKRSKALRSELASVRTKYSQLLGDALKAGEEDAVGEEMDRAMQSAVDAALDAIEEQWEARVASVEEERDAAVRLAKEATEEALALSPTVAEQQGEAAPATEPPQQSREELTAELTAALTAELTEALTTTLTATLAQDMERKYEKRRRRLRKELKRQEEQSKEELTRQQRQLIEAETKRATEQCETEHRAKMEELQRQSEEQIRSQQERMRQLVRALAAREVKARGGKQADRETGTEEEAGEDADKSGDVREIARASSSASRKKTPFRPGMVPARGTH